MRSAGNTMVNPATTSSNIPMACAASRPVFCLKTSTLSCLNPPTQMPTHSPTKPAHCRKNLIGLRLDPLSQWMNNVTAAPTPCKEKSCRDIACYVRRLKNPGEHPMWKKPASVPLIALDTICRATLLTAPTYGSTFQLPELQKLRIPGSEIGRAHV